MSLCLDLNTERRTRRLSRSQPLRVNWLAITSLAASAAVSLAILRVLWLWGVVPLWDTLLRR